MRRGEERGRPERERERTNHNPSPSALLLSLTSDHPPPLTLPLFTSSTMSDPKPSADLLKDVEKGAKLKHTEAPAESLSATAAKVQIAASSEKAKNSLKVSRSPAASRVAIDRGRARSPCWDSRRFTTHSTALFAQHRC